MDKVTIIMPVYNSEKTLNNTIKSVLNQTYKNIEFIIVNDGSTDNSAVICEKYANENSCIKYYKKENTGVSNTRNFALKKASGKYITFIDSDDLYCKDYIEMMIKILKEKNVDMVICGYKRVNYIKNKEVSRSLNNKMYKKNEYDILISKGQANNIYNQIWNKVFLKEIIKDNKLHFDETLSLGEDFRFVTSYIKHTKKIYTIDKELYMYTNSVDGLNLKYRKDRLEINLSNIRILEDFFKKNKFELTYINKKYIIAIMSGIKNICLNPNKKNINYELKRLKENKLIKEKLNIKISLKYNILAKIIKISSISMLKFYGKLLIIYDKLYNKKRLGY